MKYRKRLAAVALALAVFFSLGVNAYAEEPPAPTTEETTQAGIEQSTSIPEEVTPPAEDPPVTEEQETEETPIVYNIEELQAAIDAANDGDTILIGAKITCGESVTVGSMDKKITLAFSDDFSDNAMFCFLTQNAQEISLQNLVLSGETADDHNAFAITINMFSISPDTQGKWNFENVTFEQFTCAGAVITVSDADATFTNCCIQNNYGRRTGGIEINSDSSIEVIGCRFTYNQSGSDGAAIRCSGCAKLSESSITGNYSINDGAVKNGGGIYVDTGASCEVLSCTITGNTADIGGGISCKGTLTLRDTLIYSNTGNLGGSDIRVFGGANIVVDYTDGMDAVYAENSPVGFYKDDFERTFDAETNAEFVGETISVQNNTNNIFGVKFVFEGDLPATSPTADDNSNIPPDEEALPKEPVTVFSLEELTAAIDTAEDGDTILFGTKIYISTDTAIGIDSKNLVFKLNHDYNPDGFFYCDTQNCKNLSIKNIKFEGTQTTGQMVAAIDCPLSVITEKAVWTFENVAFERFNTSWATIIVFNTDAYLDNCQFNSNVGSSIRIGSESYVEMVNCTLSNNSTGFRGGAIQCDGQMRLQSCTITDNSAVNPDSLQGEGGAVRVGYGGICEIVSSCITGNTADYGGGVYAEGEIKLVDTFICDNTANYGGDDIYSFGGCVDVEYTDNMESVYKENAPVGFYVDDYGNRFNSQTPTDMIGETVSIKSYQNGLFGLKFVFANSLPPEEEKPEEDAESPTIPIIPPVVEIDPIPTPEPDPQPTPTPDPVPTPTQPIDPPEESEDTDTEENLPSEREEEQTAPVIGTDNTGQEAEEEIPPVTATDNDISVVEEEQDKQPVPVQETVAEEDSVVDSPASDVDNDTETSELPIEDEATTEAVQPEQEEQTAPVMIDKDEEQSAPLGIIITAVTLLSASGAIWFIKRKR